MEKHHAPFFMNDILQMAAEGLDCATGQQGERKALNHTSRARLRLLIFTVKIMPRKYFELITFIIFFMFTLNSFLLWESPGTCTVAVGYQSKHTILSNAPAYKIRLPIEIYRAYNKDRMRLHGFLKLTGRAKYFCLEKSLFLYTSLCPRSE